ncbi:acyl-CoA dehydrogenase [Kaustia mangrovi]|uniref:3-methylmercaptopropionyl-CoA dehydrogenase n=1 Tax=Kaustia mangrovi TaxID=2593653 RepID=A0A7S8C2C7_9HYPH|nr:acyl-CoA dehydrogenase [Kaustia mangrovi]QPC42077.1 acyl-CoA dehydrogenase [Kaustia mangrovi]
MSYRPQTESLTHVLNDIAGFSGLVEDGVFADLSSDLVEQILEEAGRFAGEVLAPINRVGDETGATRNPDGSVTTAPGWKEAYAQWVEAGWGGLPCPAEYGGQGLPVSLGLAVQELWNTAASAFGIGTLLTQGAAEALNAFGSDALKARYLPKLATGEWTGTMVLTEPQAGSDLGLIKTKAEPAGDGTYRIRGTKIFITYGEHDLTDNIVHFVLARLPDAPAGTKGISMFLVPKVLVNEDGSLGERNDVQCAGLEHKLGIHGSPTCTMAFGEAEGAVGWLVGEENRGLHHMFMMMNNARLHVGMQGVAVAERATQQALAYARERRQGKRPGGDGLAAIVEHPDVRRMLMDMRVRTEAARAICFVTARALDLSTHGRDEGERRANAALCALLTPVAKAFGTDTGVEVASTGIQVHGGMGFIEETGAAQHYRDARITPIYEGTNGIQAIDLVTRKVTMEGGETVRAHIASLKEIAREVAASNTPGFGETAARLDMALDALEEATEWLLGALGDDADLALAGAVPYLKLFGLASGGAYLARGALGAKGSGSGDARIRIARYFAERHLPETLSLSQVVRDGADVLVETGADSPAMVADGA